MNIIPLIEASNLTDYDQRSALGMARSWMQTGRVMVAADGVTGYEKRDALALAIVDAIRNEPDEERIAMLAEARAHINEPFVDEKMLGWQAARAAHGVVGSKKKGAVK